MKTQKIIYVVIILLSLSLVSAVNVSTDKTEYSSSELVTANIASCLGTSITKFINPDGNLVDIKSGEGNWSTTYHTASSPVKGKYTASASCSNGLSQTNFCVNAPGCLIEEEQCSPDWDCLEWSACGVDKLERRTCIDKNDCELDREESQACTAVCQESWSCSDWSDCSAGSQSRTCNDANFCGTTVYRPTLERTCQEVVVPSTTGTLPELPSEESFFQKYGLAILIISIIIVLAIMGILVYYFYYLNPKKDLGEVKDWIRKEQEKGVSDDHIQSVLEEQGWDEKDINAAFKKLK